MATQSLGFINVTTLQYAWLLQEGWEIEGFDYFCREGYKPHISVYQPVPFFRDKKASNIKEAARWLLIDKDHELQTFAMLQAFYSHFRHAYLFLGPFPLAKAYAMEAICMLMGSLFIGQKIDNIFLISEDSTWRPVFENDFAIETTHIHCLRADWLESNHPMVQREKFGISSTSWQESNWGKTIQEKLAYLSVRQDRLEQKKRPQTGRFAKFFPRRR